MINITTINKIIPSITTGIIKYIKVLSFSAVVGGNFVTMVVLTTQTP